MSQMTATDLAKHGPAAFPRQRAPVVHEKPAEHVVENARPISAEASLVRAPTCSLDQSLLTPLTVTHRLGGLLTVLRERGESLGGATLFGALGAASYKFLYLGHANHELETVGMLGAMFGAGFSSAFLVNFALFEARSLISDAKRYLSTRI